MLFNLIVGAIAGFATLYFENLPNTILVGKYKMSKPEQHVLAFAILLLGASILISLGGRDGLPFALIFGASIGYFYKYLWDICRDQYKTFRTDADDDVPNEDK
ncbi:hypothetical protein N9P72_02855 [Amylibacter sp.]|nr:hypothetical protein [Amylibacter sp.]